MLQSLIAAATAAQNKAYAPYSNFPVGAALLADDGVVYAGCNVENAAYPLSQCAESSAISAMIAGGGKRISAVLIASPEQGICPPCGACRQKIAEFSAPDTPVYMLGKNDQVETATLSELLPLTFRLDKH